LRFQDAHGPDTDSIRRSWRILLHAQLMVGINIEATNQFLKEI